MPGKAKSDGDPRTHSLNAVDSSQARKGTVRLLLATAFPRCWDRVSRPAPTVSRAANLREVHHRVCGLLEHQGREPGAYGCDVAHWIAGDHDAVAGGWRFYTVAFENAGRRPLGP